MLTFKALLLFIKTLTVGALTVPPPLSTVTLNIKNDNVQKLCNLKLAKEMPYLKSWKEVSLQTQGCTVPYYGPQGHGQFPEEVHIVHIMDVGRLMETLPIGLVPITVQLDNASCGNKTLSFSPQAPSEHYSQMNSNYSKPLLDYEEESRNKRKSLPMILKLQNMDLNPKPFISSAKQSSSRVSENPIMFTQRRPLILLLTSDQPVIWQIRSGFCWLKDQWTNIQAVVERDSSVDSDITVEVTPKTWVKKINRKNIQRFARRTYHGVASFTQIRAANYIRISTGPYGSVDTEKSLQLTLRNQNKLNFCDFSSREDSAAVMASLSVPLLAEYCVLGEEKAKNERNILIIDIEPAQTSAAKTQKEENKPSISNNNSLVRVYLSEKQSGTFGSQGNNGMMEELNFTIILRSSLNMHWIFSSRVQQNGLQVVLDEGDTIHYMDNSGRVLNTTFLPLPQSRSELLQKVLSEFAATIHYFKTNQATGVSLTIGNFQQRTDQPRGELRPFLSTSILQLPSGHFLQQSAVAGDLDDAGNEKNILRILDSEMVLVCGKTLFEIILPAPILMHLGVKTLHLKDRLCQSQSNGTHFILKSSLNSCGSDTHTSGKTSVVSNSVYVDVFSLSGSRRTGPHLREPSNPELTQTGIPIACGLKPALDDDDDDVRSIFVSRGAVTSEEEDDGLASSSQSSASSSIYQLELYHLDAVSGTLTPIKYRDIIDLKRRIYVQAWMDDAPSAQAVIESCWISSLPHSAVWLPNQKKVLLRGMCPVEIGVRLEKQVSQNKAFGFSFQVIEEFLHMGQELYMHCQVGVCLSHLKHIKGKPVLCVDPLSHCQHMNPLSPSSALLSTAHQLLTRGPIVVQFGGQTFLPDLLPEIKCTNVSISPYSITISMDMTVLIALCSFVIGIGLTATLWYIHNKTEPARRSYHGREHSLGSQTAVLGSSLSPHSACSSTNSQSIITS